MPTMMSHIAVPLAMKYGFGREAISGRLLFVAMLCSILPDFDVVAFSLGIPYESQWGHRGFTHSISFAVILGILASVLYRSIHISRTVVFWVITISTASHALLDAATDGGLGVALFWPFINDRVFLPWTPIEVSPIGIQGFLSERGAVVLLSEFYWIWLPAVVFVMAINLFRLFRSRRIQITAEMD